MYVKKKLYRIRIRYYVYCGCHKITNKYHLSFVNRYFDRLINLVKFISFKISIILSELLYVGYNLAFITYTIVFYLFNVLRDTNHVTNLCNKLNIPTCNVTLGDRMLYPAFLSKRN